MPEFIKKETLAQVFSCEFCEISKNTFSYRTPPVAASEYIYKVKDCEFWWNFSIQTATMLRHNKLDTVVEICCPADVNITKKVEEKLNNYGPLICNLQIMYPQYKLQMVPIVTGALSYVPKSLEMYKHQRAFRKIETEKLVRKLQNLSASVLLRYVKPS